MAGETPGSPVNSDELMGRSGGRHFRPEARGELGFGVVVAVLFAALLFPLILQHAMWRDELQVWQLVRARPWVGQLLNSARYEGHPILWFLLVDLVGLVTANPVGMQLLHASIACGTVFIVAWRAPWARVLRGIFALGYFPLFEYGLLSRNYAIGVFLGFLACAMIASPGRMRLMALALVLLLMSQCNVFAAIVAVALAFGALAEWLARRNAGRDEAPVSHMAIAIAVMAAGLAALGLEMRPAADAGMYQYWHPGIRLFWVESAMASMAHVFLPAPARVAHFWGSNFLDGSPRVAAVIAAALCIPVAAVALRRPAAAALAMVAFCGILGFLYIKVAPWGLRHEGHLLVAYLMADWMSRRGTAWPDAARQPIFHLGDRWADAFLGFVLAVQACCGVFAAWQDVRVPFSAGKETARYIQAHFPADVPIVGDMDAAASTVAGYLNRPIYYVDGHREGTFIIWDKKRTAEQVNAEAGQTYADPIEVFRQADRLAAAQSRDVVVVFSRILDRDMQEIPNRAPPPAGNVRMVWRSGDANEADEEYDLYVVSDPTTRPSP